MAICFVRAKVIGRSGGMSAVAAAAYRSGSKITDGRTGIVHDYTKKQGVEHSEILSPIAATGSNEWLTDRAALWNQVELSEKRPDAQLSREMIIAIPRELDRDMMIALVRQHVQASYVDRGMIADINLHHLDSDNPHAHVMLTMRELKIDEQGVVSFGNKDRSWNDKKLVETQKREWEILANQYLEHAGIETRIDARSYEEQGIARIPQVHVGSAAWRLEQQGISTAPGDRNREVAAVNRAIENSQTEIATAQTNIETELRLEIERRAAEAVAKIERERVAVETEKVAENRAALQSIVDLVQNRLAAPQFDVTPPEIVKNALVTQVDDAEKYFPTRLEIVSWLSNRDCNHHDEIYELGMQLRGEFMSQDSMIGQHPPDSLPDDYKSDNVWILIADKNKYDEVERIQRHEAAKRVELLAAEVAKERARVEMVEKLIRERNEREAKAAAARIQRGQEWEQPSEVLTQIEPTAADTHKYSPTRAELLIWWETCTGDTRAEIDILGQRLKSEYQGGTPRSATMPNDYKSDNVSISIADKERFDLAIEPQQLSTAERIAQQREKNLRDMTRNRGDDRPRGR
jgi:MobA/MobL family